MGGELDVGSAAPLVVLGRALLLAASMPLSAAHNPALSGVYRLLQLRLRAWRTEGPGLPQPSLVSGSATGSASGGSCVRESRVRSG